jgi:hypothetical protein
MKQIIAGAASAAAIVAAGTVAGCAGSTTTVREVPVAAASASHPATPAPTATRTVTAPAASSAPAAARPAAPAAGSSYCGSPADQGGITVSAHVSCPFAQNVESAWDSSGGASSVTAYSPVTGLTYTLSCSATGSGYEVCTGADSTWMEFPASASASAPAPASGPFTDATTLAQSVTDEQQAALAAAPADDYDSTDDAPASVSLTPLGDGTYAATAADSDGDAGSGDTITVSADGTSWSDTGMNWSGPDVYTGGGVTDYWTTPAVSGYS